MRNVLERNAVQVSGVPGGRPIVFAHGFGCDQGMWRFVAPDFEVDHRVVLFDQVGSGNSDLSAYDRDKYGSLRGYAADLVEICRELQLTDVVFVGHSVSAMIGLLATLDEPARFRSQIMIGPSPCYINDDSYTGGFSRADIESLLDTLDSNYLGWASAMGPTIMGAPDRPELGQELTNSFCRTDPEIAKHFAHVTFLSDNRADLPRSTVPALIVQCSDDLIAPRSVGDYLLKHLPNSKLAPIDNIGHCPHLSAPQAIATAMRDYLASQ